MVYYIDVQPAKKKLRLPMSRLRSFIYPSALFLSLCLTIPYAFSESENRQTAFISRSDAVVSASSYEIVQDLSVMTFSGFVSPLDNAIISSHFGYRTNPVTGVYKLHGGLDLACGEGSDVHAVLGGEVILSEYSDSYGNYLIIEHGNGYQTLYAHCSKLLKKEGDSVECGETIALSGNTGNSTGPHLHIEVRENGERIDPEPFFGRFFQ